MSAFAQVGILTENPQGMFHADPKHNTAVSLADTLNVENGVTVTAAGNPGIGALPPAAAGTIGLRLTGGAFCTIRSPLRIGRQRQEGRVPTGDASGNGYATWQPRPAGYEPPGRGLTTQTAPPRAQGRVNVLRIN